MRVMEEPLIATVLAENLYRLRKARGWSVSKLARTADVSHAYIEKLEAGRTASPSLVPLQRLADALGVTLDDLLTADPDGSREEAQKYETEEEFISRYAVKYGDSEAFREAVELFQAHLRFGEADRKMLLGIVRRLNDKVDD